MKKKWVSWPQETIEDAIALYQYDLFSPAAIFKTPGGKYVLSYLNVQAWSDEFVTETADKLKDLLDYEMVASCSPMIAGWRTYPDDEPIAT